MTIFHYDLNEIVSKDHAFRKFKKWLPTEIISRDWEELKKGLGREGYGYALGLRALFIQFYGDHSDREMEEQLKYNVLYRWFCGLAVDGGSPDHSYFGRVRKALGVERVSKLFQTLVRQSDGKGLLNGVSVFVDSSAIKRKEATWEERDKAKKDGEESQDNKTVHKYSYDKEARWGCKGKKKYWFGYKRHVCVDMESGLITEADVTPGNVPDDDGFKSICPWNKRVVGDKGYDSWKVIDLLRKRRCEDGILRKKNRRDFDQERNNGLSRERSPFERVFSKVNKRTRYAGLEKTLMQVLWESIVHNMKRMVVLDSDPSPGYAA